MVAITVMMMGLALRIFPHSVCGTLAFSSSGILISATVSSPFPRYFSAGFLPVGQAFLPVRFLNEQSVVTGLVRNDTRGRASPLQCFLLFPLSRCYLYFSAGF